MENKTKIHYNMKKNNEKRLICFSKINEEKCRFGLNCSYAHNLSEQKIDEEKLKLYQIILDKNLMNFQKMSKNKIDEMYKNLLFSTNVCKNCLQKKCTGGYNCKNGVCHFSLKICKNDLLTGQCLNKIINIDVDKKILKIINSKDFEKNDCYIGCLNGHHLTNRKLVPYYKYVEHVNKNLNDQNEKFYIGDNTSSNSTDEEINEWFQERLI